MKKVKIDTHHNYEVLIAPGLIDRAGDLIYDAVYKGHNAANVKVLVVYNDDVRRYAAKLIDSLGEKGFMIYPLEVPIGEETKDYVSAGAVLDFLVKNDFSREDMAVSCGGGSISDVVGFMASVYKRGMRLVHVPTTLLAMIDGAVGGKTALNYGGAKNLVGSFYQPDLVIEDINVLKTVEGRNLRSGAGELIKYGVLDKKIFYKLYSRVRVDNVEDLIYDCVKLKAKYVTEDEYDEGPRHLLNLGHTVGHAIETLSGYKTPHGIAVATGALCVAHCMDKIYGTDSAAQIKRVLDIQGIITEIPYAADDILRMLKKDKKWAYGKLSLVVVHGIGDCRIQEFTPEELEEFLKGGMYAR